MVIVLGYRDVRYEMVNNACFFKQSMNILLFLLQQ